MNLSWDPKRFGAMICGLALLACFSACEQARAQLKAALAALVIDSGFIDRKFARFNAVIRQKPPKNIKAVSSLLRKATQLVGDGKYQAVNRELNKIFALL
jgi:hypothetical protein